MRNYRSMSRRAGAIKGQMEDLASHELEVMVFKKQLMATLKALEALNKAAAELPETLLSADDSMSVFSWEAEAKEVLGRINRLR